MKVDLISCEDTNRYLVRNTAEIERILRDVMNDKNIVTIYLDEDRHFMLSSVVGLDPVGKCLYLDFGADEEMNRMLLSAPAATLTTSHDQVRVQFQASGVSKAVQGQSTVFRVPMPSELLRLQRREYYRLVTSVVNPIKCLIGTETGDLEATVVDISIGGIGVLAYQQDLLLHPGRIYHGCRLTLPEIGQFAVSLKVCSTFDVVLKNGRHTHRAGCQFTDLPTNLETEIQRYIIKADRERRRRFM